ncbi:MAG: hypothetical protein E7374_03810 [Clostridiales bacterium]|nr:hypothetical protein [Clostridiales bacterium]
MKGKQFINVVSYVAVAFIAVALAAGKLLGWLINPQVLHVLTLIAQIIAYTITAVFAFYFAKSKRSKGWMIAYAVFVIIIVVFLVVNNI